MGTRMEQPGEFLPRAGRAGSSQPEGLADSLYRLSSAAEDLQVITSCCNRALLLQGAFCITLKEPEQTRPMATTFFPRATTREQVLPSGSAGERRRHV